MICLFETKNPQRNGDVKKKSAGFAQTPLQMMTSDFAGRPNPKHDGWVYHGYINAASLPLISGGQVGLFINPATRVISNMNPSNGIVDREKVISNQS